MVKYSVIVPIYNEKETVGVLCQQIKDVMDKVALSYYEIIFVDDGSTDGSLYSLKKIATEIKELIILSLDRNYGQSSAIQAGFDNASGEILISIDGDGQYEPKDIPRLLDKLDNGYDVVCGRRYKRDDPRLKIISSKVANILRRILFREKIHDVGCTFRAYTRGSLTGINLDGCKHRFLTTILAKRGAKIGEVEIKSRPRLYGSSKYGIIDRIIKSILEILQIYFFNNKSNFDKKSYNIKKIYYSY